MGRPVSAPGRPAVGHAIAGAWPLAALGLIGVLVVASCQPRPPAPPPAQMAAEFDPWAATHIATWHALAALDALGADAPVEEVVAALNLAVFDFGPADAHVPAEGATVLAQAAQSLGKLPAGQRIEVGVHTARGPSPEADLSLSEQRAQAVVEQLVELGVPAAALKARGYGSSEPLDPGDGAEARYRNRRVEFRQLP